MSGVLRSLFQPPFLLPLSIMTPAVHRAISTPIECISRTPMVPTLLSGKSAYIIGIGMNP